jgi:hypothetical protein
MNVRLLTCVCLLALSGVNAVVGQQSDNFSRPFHGLANAANLLPSDESLGYHHSSAIADWKFRTDN